MATRPAFRTALTLLSLPALAGLIGVGQAQSLAPGRAAIRRPAAHVAIQSSHIPLGALGQNGPAAPAIVQGGRLLRIATPTYPLAAKRAGISGMVTVEALIGVDGRVVRTGILRGPGSLHRIAQDTVRSWRYEPTLLNGKPVQRVAEVNLRFVLDRY